VDAGGEAQEGLEGSHRSPPPIEAKRELVQVDLEVIVTDTVVGAAEPGLEIAVRQKLAGPSYDMLYRSESAR